MFSGIIEAIGEVRSVRAAQICIDAPSFDDLQTGDSVAVDGCCLTVAAVESGGFSADVTPETARRTTLGWLRAGDAVNLERALRANDRLGGHLVSGHVDATGVVTAIEEESNARRVRVDSPGSLLELVAPQGSIAIDGISLTVVDVSPGSLSVSLIPHTTARTTAGRWTVGARVNLEADPIARYVRRTLQLVAPSRTTALLEA